ncbi:MAG: Mu transposase domain-containing protein, partial [Actinomycetes bacterium]
TRTVRTIKAAPADLVDVDRAGMLALPPIPLHLGWRNRIRLGRDYYVRIDSNDYSVDPTAIGRMVDVTADLDRVRVRADKRVVADHERLWMRGATLTDPVHVETAAMLRKQFQQPRPAVRANDDLARDLADYDRAFGLLDGQVS